MKAKKSKGNKGVEGSMNPNPEIGEPQLEASAVWGPRLELMPAEQPMDEPTPLLTSTIWGVLPPGTRLYK
jgi:hypothetical protein